MPVELRFGTELSGAHNTVAESPRIAAIAEKSGFDYVWVPDHIRSAVARGLASGGDMYPELWTNLTSIGLSTKKIVVAPGVTDCLRRHPATVAQIVASLDRLLQGRVILGVGAGEAMNLDPYGIVWDNPVQRLQEAISVIRMLWRSSMDEPANFEGRYHRLNGAFMEIRPIRENIPIYIGSLGKRMREITGELGDGWYPWINTPSTYARALEDVCRGAERVGRTIDEIDTTTPVLTAISTDRDEARKAVETRAKVYLLAERHVLESLGYQPPVGKDFTVQRMILDKEQSQRMLEVSSAIPSEYVEQIAAFGSPDDCIEKMEELIEAGARHLVIENVSTDPEGSYGILGSKIIPYLRSQYRE
jgi:alkanesulfonate monooxygenase SsuD/methylene tetrahydromethanopterin reductase-like flavin-dependent oxidoreductase (luciferase family)